MAETARYHGVMKASAKEFAVVFSLFAGLVAFPLLQWSSRAFLKEGLITFWIHRSIESVRQARVATSTPETIPAPDLTRPFAVMIDNYPDARPQSGLSRADMVIESLVEGGLTRFMAVFKSATATEIGPVRSARPYFLDWARGLDAVYAHFGGSDEALRRLADGSAGLNDADGMKDGVTFWRDAGRRAPHNAYTSTERMRLLIASRGWPAATLADDAFIRSQAELTGSPASVIDIRYGDGYGASQFRYLPESQAYARFADGIETRDRDGSAVRPTTVAVIETDLEKIDDPHGKGLIGLRTFGEGRVKVFQNGAAVAGSWRKRSAKEPLELFDAGHKKIAFSFGPLWLTVIVPGRGGSVAFR